VADPVVIDGETYKRRSPTAAWLLTIATLLVYWFVWYYKINDEARRYLRDTTIRPWLSVAAIFPGVVLIVPFFVSIYRTGQRIQRIEQHAGSQKLIRPALGTLFAFLTLLTIALLGGCLFYFQGHLNTAWTAAKDPRDPTPAAP
jgi:hypothetical protein